MSWHDTTGKSMYEMMRSKAAASENLNEVVTGSFTLTNCPILLKGLSTFQVWKINFVYPQGKLEPDPKKKLHTKIICIPGYLILLQDLFEFEPSCSKAPGAEEKDDIIVIQDNW